MFVFVIFLSYFIGCLSTIAILIYLCIRGLGSPGTIYEQEQYQTFHPLSENDQAKNSTVDTINCIFQFLFQEMRDTSKVRRYIMKKLHVEINDAKKTKLGKIFLQDILIKSFSLGKECPIFSDIQFERHERDERQLIKEFVAKVDVDYKDGFSVTLDIKLLFGYKCQLYIKVKRIQGHLHIEFRREPFSHWLAVFQDEPFIDFDIKSYILSRESSQLSEIIGQQIRRIIRRKQIWPAYKIRYQPFFTKSKQSLSTEILSPNGNNLIPGTFDITIKHCDRLSIPYEIFKKNKNSLLSIFLTISINEQMCQDYLQINRDQWRKKQIIFIPKLYKINIKQVIYMNRTEFLIDEFDPIPNEIDDKDTFKAALEDKNIFLLEIQGQQVKTLKKINRFIYENDKQIEILVGMPLLHSVRVRQQRTEEINQSNHSNNSIQQQNSDLITVIMMNDDLLEEFQAKTTPTQKPEAYVEFKHDVQFQVGPDERFLNICLWCRPPLDCEVPNLNKKLILLGYSTVALSEIVFDAQMSFKRETQMTLNFQSVYSDSGTDSARKLAELSTHKNYDKDMVHGFVTINVKHRPEIEINVNQDEKRERSNSTEAVIIEKDDEFLTSINEELESPPLKSTNHIFEDQTFHVGTPCAYCNNKIWMKAGRQCRICLRTVHKKCEDKFNNETTCTRENIRSTSTVSEDETSILSTDTIDSRTSTPHLSRKLDPTVRQSFHRFGYRNVKSTSTSSPPEISRNDDSDNNSSSPHPEKRPIPNQPVQTSSKFRFRVFNTKQPSTSQSKTRSSLESIVPENISEDDLQDIITTCLSDEHIGIKSLENLFHEKAIDHTAVYAKANQYGAELFRDYTPEERREKLENEISRLQQELDLQRRIRDETIIEYNNSHNLTDENAKRKIKEKLANIDEKTQALAALTIFYCSGLKFCCSEMETKNDNNNINSKRFSDNSLNETDNEQ